MGRPRFGEGFEVILVAKSEGFVEQPTGLGDVEVGLDRPTEGRVHEEV